MKRLASILASLCGGAAFAASVGSVTPGANFESLAVSGTATAGETVKVVLHRDSAGTAVTNSVAAGTDGAFTTSFTGLTAGEPYRIAIGDVGGAVQPTARTVAAGWIAEDAQTFDGIRTGTGKWSGRAYAKTSGGAIEIAAAGTNDEAVTFTPTVIPTYRGYRVSATVSFSLVRSVTDLESTVNGVFGVSPVSSNGELQLAILDQKKWKLVSRDVFAPELAARYDFEFFVDEEQRLVRYYLKTSEGTVAYLGSGAVSDGMNTRFGSADFLGYGAVGALAGDGYDDDLIAYGVSFDNLENGRLQGGMNFTNLLVSGSVDVSNLWETTATKGTLHIAVVEHGGATNEVWQAAWTDAQTTYDFSENVALKAGGEYDVVTWLELDDASLADRVSSTDDSSVEAILAREDGAFWFDENGETVAHPAWSYGVWQTNGAYSVTGGPDGEIVFTDDSTGDSETGYGLFVPTNDLPSSLAATCVRFETSFDLVGDFATLETIADARYGVSLVKSSDSVWTELALLFRGTWHLVPHATFAAYEGVRYTFELCANETVGEEGVTYYVIDSTGRRTFLATYTFDEAVVTADVRPDRVKFIGSGSCSLLRGTVYDTSLVKVTVSLDGQSLDGALFGGMNFTNLLVSGSIGITNLWETDLTSGKITVSVNDSQGTTVKTWTTDWSSFSDYGFTNLVENLTRGEAYTIDVRVTSDDASRQDSIAGDANWAGYGMMAVATNLWYLENGPTVDDPSRGTGVWTAQGDMLVASALNGGIDFEGSGFFDADSAHFVPTNPAPSKASVSRHHASVKVNGSTPLDTLPDVTGASSGYGFALDDSDELVFAYVSGGAWKTLPRTEFAADRDETCTIDVALSSSGSDGIVTYTVAKADGSARTVVYGTYSLADCGIWPKAIDLYGQGNVRDLSGTLYDPSLISVTVDFGSGTMPGTNFTAVVASGTVTVKPLWETDQTNLVVHVAFRDDVTRAVIAERTLAVSGSAAVSFTVDGLQPGTSYTVETTIDDASAAIASGDSTVRSDVSAPTAKAYAGVWIDEDADTFLRRRPQTGYWSYGTVQASVQTTTAAGRAIVINTEMDESVRFDATNATPEVLGATLREITLGICMEGPGFALSDEEKPVPPTNEYAGVTIACDDSDSANEVFRFALYQPDDQSWIISSNAVAKTGAAQTVIVHLSYANPLSTNDATITYFLRNDDGSRTLLGQVTPKCGLPEVNADYRNEISFVGAGMVTNVYGECQDAHLAEVDGVEYWTIDEAIAAIGESDRYLVPRWFCTYSVTNAPVRFGVLDRNVPPYLTLDWPIGYMVEITEKKGVKYYYYFLSDYWRDWADKSGVEETAAGYSVTNAAGLAWVAKNCTNRWLQAEIRLTDDITNLFEHVWTPIEGFTGTFEGDGHVIAGLKNGDYMLGPTNELKMTAYGLFASASNSVFRNVTFEDVAISNASDAVGALLGCAIGDLAVTNVYVKSGTITGTGRYVAGLVGCVMRPGDVSLAFSTNAAAVAAASDALTDQIVAGLANLGSSEAGALAQVSVVSNENRGALSGKLDLTAGVGNVAQVLATGDDALPLASAVAKGNVGTGDVSGVTVEQEGIEAQIPLPIVNFAAEVAYVNAIENLKMYIEANDATEMLIDPQYHTARTTGGWYFNGETNMVGRLNDLISCTLAGGTVTLPWDVEAWGSVVLDRPINLDLNEKVIDNVFDTNTFYVTEEAAGAVVYNGTVTSPEGKFANVAPTNGLVTAWGWATNNLKYVSWNTNYWDRGLYYNGEFVQSLPAIKSLLMVNAVLSVPEGSAYAVDAASSAITYNGQKVLSLAQLGYTVSEDGAGGYVIAIDTKPATAPATTAIELSLEPNGGTSTVTLTTGTRADCEYCLQSVSSLAEDWDKPGDAWVSPAKDGDPLEFTANTSTTSAFYRIKVRKQ